MKGLRAYLGFASLGFGMAVALFGYLGGTDYTPQGGLLISAAIVLCPSCLFSLAIIDAEPHTSGVVFVWSIMAILNALFYATIGPRVIRFLRNSKIKSTSKSSN
jgi:hypothetical protein